MGGLFQFQEALFKFVLHYDAGGRAARDEGAMVCFNAFWYLVLLFALLTPKTEMENDMYHPSCSSSFHHLVSGDLLHKQNLETKINWMY